MAQLADVRFLASKGGQGYLLPANVLLGIQERGKEFRNDVLLMEQVDPGEYIVAASLRRVAQRMGDDVRMMFFQRTASGNTIFSALSWRGGRRQSEIDRRIDQYGGIECTESGSWNDDRTNSVGVGGGWWTFSGSWGTSSRCSIMGLDWRNRLIGMDVTRRTSTVYKFANSISSTVE